APAYGAEGADERGVGRRDLHAARDEGGDEGDGRGGDHRRDAWFHDEVSAGGGACEDDGDGEEVFIRAEQLEHYFPTPVQRPGERPRGLLGYLGGAQIGKRSERPGPPRARRARPLIEVGGEIHALRVLPERPRV